MIWMIVVWNQLLDIIGHYISLWFNVIKFINVVVIVRHLDDNKKPLILKQPYEWIRINDFSYCYQFEVIHSIHQKRFKNSIHHFVDVDEMAWSSVMTLTQIPCYWFGQSLFDFDFSIVALPNQHYHITDAHNWNLSISSLFVVAVSSRVLQIIVFGRM